MTCGVDHAFELLKDHIASTHVHDNWQEKDEHLLPFAGGIDWESTVRGFRELAGQVPIMFELRNFGPAEVCFEKLHEIMKRMEDIH